LQQAFDWSRIGLAQGIVTSQNLGTGLIAGYRGSGESLRPGFAWFFGRDALWTSLALNAERDFATSRMTFDFLIKYQRADGKIPHEVSQSAGFVPWFRDYPYAFASADATPLLLIAINDYVSQSGDAGYAREKWEQIWKAYQFLASTFDSSGFAQNRGVGHGWVEGGPLVPVDAEFYQSALGVEATRALAHLAQAVGKPDVEKDLMDRFARQKSLLNQTFWSEKNRSFIFGVNGGKDQADFLSTLATVPMWFQLVDQDKAEVRSTNWQVRILHPIGECGSFLRTIRNMRHPDTTLARFGLYLRGGLRLENIAITAAQPDIRICGRMRCWPWTVHWAM